MTNPILDNLMHHRSIRKFKPQPITDSQVEILLQAAKQASTSQFEQQFSVISVTDPAKLQVLADVTTFDFVKNAGHYFLFIADQHRNEKIIKSINPKLDTSNLHSADKLLAGVHDADFAMQAMLMEAESMGLGGVVMGSIYNDPQKIIDTFKLPELTFPVLGLALGAPDEEPEVKPRITSALIHYQNEYDDQINENYLDKYNQIVAEYYAGRSTNNKNDTFTDHLIKDLKNNPVRLDLLPALKRQKFLKY